SGTASSGDFGGFTSSVQFEAGQSTVVLDLSPVDDQFIEGLEDLRISLKSGSGYHLGIPYSAAGILAENDGVNLVLDNLSESEEMDPGALIQINNDDDNTNGIPDLQELGTVAGEDDLVGMQLHVPAQLASGWVTLSMTGGHMRVWSNSQKGEGNLVL